jgi:2C-methyl-D-erythritol 2,4-cyclodiphosphate synthase
MLNNTLKASKAPMNALLNAASVSALDILLKPADKQRRKIKSKDQRRLITSKLKRKRRVASMKLKVRKVKKKLKHQKSNVMKRMMILLTSSLLMLM